MIFKDVWSSNDREIKPWNRSLELCVNCGKGWYSHSGWGCDSIWGGFAIVKFSETIDTNRYMTSSMQKSIQSPLPPFGKIDLDELMPNTLKSADSLERLEKCFASTKNVEEPEWKKWRDVNRKPNECPCGALYGKCEFHPVKQNE